MNPKQPVANFNKLVTGFFNKNMQNHIFGKTAILILLIISLGGCDVNDHFMESCYQPYILRVVVSNDADDDFHPEIFAPNDMSLMLKPTEVKVFIFSEDMTFLGSHRAKINEQILLSYTNPKIYAVAVGTDESVDIENTFTQFEVGQKYEKVNQLFTLVPITGKTDAAVSPSDFMYANDNFLINPYNDRNVVYYLYLNPKIGALKITTTNLAEWTDKNFGKSGLPQDEFTFRIGTTLNRYNLEGGEYGEQVSYWPTVTHNDDVTITTSMFNLMPTTTNNRVQIYIYRNGTLIYPGSGTSFSYTVRPRAPYIIHLNFDVSEPNVGVTPAKFRDIYIYQNFT